MENQSNEHMENNDELITLDQAAQISGLKQVSLQSYAAKGRLKARKLGNFWVTTYAHLYEYLESRHQGKKSDD